MPTARDKLLELYQQRDFGDVLTGDPGSAPAGLAGLVMNPKNAQKILSSSKVLGLLDYMLAKYPRLSKLPNKINYKINKIGGEYNPYDKIVSVDAPLFTPMQRQVEILGHELTHAYRDRRGLLKSILEYNGSTELEESLARQGGVTAQKTYEKFMELIK
jgi:hypothetical protein